MRILKRGVLVASTTTVPPPAPAPATGVSPTGPAPEALGVTTPHIRLRQRTDPQGSAWHRIHRIERFRLARGLKLRMRVNVTVQDPERRSYVVWPQATATVEVGTPGQPGIENAKDLVWAIDELIEAVGRVGPEAVALALRALRPGVALATMTTTTSPVPVIPLADDRRPDRDMEQTG